MRRWVIGVCAVAIAAAIGLIKFPRVTCNNLPRIRILVHGAAPGPGQVSGAGSFCGTEGDGKPVTVLAPVLLHPKATVTVIYDTRVRWDRVTFTISQGEKVISEGQLRGREGRFTLPDVPGIYQVSIAYRWDGWASGEQAYGSEYFQIEVNPSPTTSVYPRNARGETFGSSLASATEEPDLILAYGVGGTMGYVRAKDLNDVLQPKTPEEAVAYMRAKESAPYSVRNIPLYAADGETIIGVFQTSGHP